MKTGYNLIELMITITIVGILVGFGVSAYGKARDRQIGLSAGEQIVSIFQANQTIANIGKKDCNGKYAGQKVDLITPNTIQVQSRCELPPQTGSVTSTTINGITFSGNATIIFNPLSRGINLGGPSEMLINYNSSVGLTYRLKLTSSGTIENQGVQ